MCIEPFVQLCIYSVRYDEFLGFKLNCILYIYKLLNPKACTFSVHINRVEGNREYRLLRIPYSRVGNLIFRASGFDDKCVGPLLQKQVKVRQARHPLQ